MTYTLAPSADVSTLGLPSAGWNVGTCYDYDTPRFINRAKQARGWPNNWSDHYGHLLVSPPSPPSTLLFYFASAGNVPFMDGTYRGGTFRLTWEGSGQVLGGEAISNLSGSSSGLTFDFNGTAGDAWITFSSIDWANPPRNLAIVRTDQIAAYEAGAIFDPDMLALISGASCYRFLDWQRTNGAELANWADRNIASAQRWMNDLSGVPLEICIALCNETDTDGWFLIPHTATDDFVTNFVQYVYDNLNPGLVARFEWSNEYWNFGFSQWTYVQNQAWLDWGPEGWQIGDPQDYAGTGFSGGAPLAWGARRSTQVMQIVRSIYGTSKRAVCVFGVHTAGVNQGVIEALAWQQYDPDGYIDPRLWHDEMAITTYWGHGILNDYDDQIAAEITNNGEAAAVAYALPLVDAEADAQIAHMTTMGALARANGYTMSAYEANMHVAGYGPALGSGYNQPTAEALSFANALNYSAGMAAQHVKVLNGFRAAGGGLCCMYKDFSPHAASGSWGIWRYRSDTNPVAAAVTGWFADPANDRWWPK